MAGNTLYRDGIFNEKMMHLMALTGSIAAGCDSCILLHAKKAAALGTTEEEVSEVCRIAASLGGSEHMLKMFSKAEMAISIINSNGGKNVNR